MSSFKAVPDKFKIKVDINNMKFLTEEAEGKQEISSPVNIQGKWSLEFEVKKSNLKEVKTLNPNIKSDYSTINKKETEPKFSMK